MFEIHRVKSGDCLWDIAKARFGYAQFWPSIYSFNNWAAAHQIQHAGFIVDPALIHPNQTILLPDLDMTLLRRVIENPHLVAAVAQADARAAGRAPSHATDAGTPLVRSAAQVARKMRRNPAAYLGFKPFWALEYDLDDLGTETFRGPGFTAEITWSGKVLMQPVHDEPLITLSNRAAVMAQEFKADTAFGELGGEVSMTWKPGDKQPGFTCNLTRAGHGPIPKITVEVDRDGPKFKLSWKPFRGQFHSYELVAVCAAEIKVKPNVRGNPDGSEPPRNMNITPITAPPNVATASRQGNMTAITGRPKQIVARNPHRFSAPTITPNGLAPLIGIGMASILGFIVANPEVLVFAAL